MILLAEDEVNQGDLFLHMLERWGFDALLRTNGSQAWDTLTRNAFLIDIALLDVDLPGLTGLEVGQRIRSFAPANHLQIIFMTGMSNATVIHQAAVLNIQNYLIKPVDTRTLEATLVTCLRQKLVHLRPSGVEFLGRKMDEPIYLKLLTEFLVKLKECHRVISKLPGSTDLKSLPSSFQEVLELGTTLGTDRLIGVNEEFAKTGTLNEATLLIEMEHLISIIEYRIANRMKRAAKSIVREVTSDNEKVQIELQGPSLALLHRFCAYHSKEFAKTWAGLQKDGNVNRFDLLEALHAVITMHDNTLQSLIV